MTSLPGPEIQTIAGRPLLSNNQVNLASASLTALLTAFAALKIFWY